MNCRKVSRWLSAYIEGDLLPHQAVRIEDHLRNCAQCREKVTDLRLIIQTAGELDRQQPGPYFLNRLLCAINAKRQLLETLMGWRGKMVLSGTSFVVAAIVTFMAIGPQMTYMPMAGNPSGDPAKMAIAPVEKQTDSPVQYRGFPVPNEALQRDMALIESLKTDTLKTDSIFLSNRFIQQVEQKR
jgi:hypothetical protein